MYRLVTDATQRNEARADHERREGGSIAEAY
jgi:hypothetical protein